jgi:salicylate hydroxylase
MFDREPIDNWVTGRLAMTGDAAHPMLQYLAQGACQALEDADCLAAMAGKHAVTQSGPDAVDWPAALHAYAEVRTVRTARLQRTARDWGELWHCDGLFRAVRNAMLTDRDPADYRHIDWLYGS